MSAEVTLTRPGYVRVPADLDAVTTIDAGREVYPPDLGVTRGAASLIWDAARDLYRTGVYPALSLCIRRRGQILLNRSLGHARGNAPNDPVDAPKVLATPDTPFCIYSASKAVTAMAIHLLDDQGLLHVDDRICEYIPEFARHGKEWATIRHVLTHRAGIPTVAGAGAPSLEQLEDWPGLIEMLCDARPVAVPGRRLAYHAITGGFLLGEIVHRVTGRDLRQFLADEVLDPLGFRGMNYGTTAEGLQTLAHSARTGPQVPFPLTLVVNRAFGVSMDEAVDLTNHPTYLTGLVPSGNIVATADEASRFFQLLLNNGELDGVRVFDERTVRRAVTETAYHEMDFTLGFPVRYGVGFMLGSKRLSMFGPRTPRAFGHLGFINIFVYADPDRDLAVAIMTSGKPALSPHLLPLWKLLRAISAGCPPRR